MSVFDICCGKGGDLLKWKNAKIGHYVGADLAESSVEAAANRYWDMTKKYGKWWPSIFIVSDVGNKEDDLMSHIPEQVTFDMVSC